MNKARVGLIVAAALAGLLGVAGLPATASAQPKAPKKEAKDKKGDKKDQQPKEVKLEEEPKKDDKKDETPVAGDQASDQLETICKIDPSACPSVNLDEAAKRDMKVKMYAVQQIYALRYRRVEVNPYFGITMNDQFVLHPGPGLGINFYITNVLAVGVNGNFYAGLNANSAFNLQTSRAARIGEPITEYQWNANANFTYVPAYGKFAGFSDFIFHWDVFVLGGVGAISTRPIAVVDPDNRSFSFKPKVAFHLGGGLRIFFNRWLAVVLEISDYIFVDELENPTIATGVDASNKPKAQDPTTWIAKESSITNNVQAQVGLSVFLPFTWEYKLPK